MISMSLSHLPAMFSDNRNFCTQSCAFMLIQIMSQTLIGRKNLLKILRETDSGLYLASEDEGEILLPRRYVPKKFAFGDELEVFISYDSDDRLFASTEMPYVQVGEFAQLKVAALESVGAFLDWGMPKDLFLPYSEQTRPLKLGQSLVVFVYLDKSDRISATMRWEKHVDKTEKKYEVGNQVDLFIAARTDMGFKAVINNEHSGILYSNEIFRPLHIGEKTKGYIKNIREDGKIDLNLEALGNKGSADIGEKILERLRQNKGFLPIDDKTSAELIYDWFGVSKKKYKMALGGLYKKRLITIHDDGIRLV